MTDVAREIFFKSNFEKKLNCLAYITQDWIPTATGFLKNSASLAANITYTNIQLLQIYIYEPLY